MVYDCAMRTIPLTLALAGGLLAATACDDSSGGGGGFLPSGNDAQDGGVDGGGGDVDGISVGAREVKLWDYVSADQPAVVVDYTLVHHANGIADRVGWVYWEPILDREEQQVVNIRGPTITNGFDDPTDLTLTAMVPDFTVHGGTTGEPGNKVHLVDITAQDLKDLDGVANIRPEHNAGRRNELELGAIRCEDRLDVIGVHQVPDTREFIHVCHAALAGSRTGGAIEREDGDSIPLGASATLLAVGPDGAYLYWTGSAHEIRNFDDDSIIYLDTLQAVLGGEIDDARPLDEGWALLVGQSLWSLRYSDGTAVHIGDYPAPEKATRCRIAEDGAIWCLVDTDIVRYWIDEPQMEAGSEVVFSLPAGAVMIVTPHARTIYRRDQI